MGDRGPNTNVKLVKYLAQRVGFPTPLPTSQVLKSAATQDPIPLDATLEWFYFGQVDLEVEDFTIYPQEDGKGGMVLTPPPPGSPAVEPCVLHRYDFPAADGGIITLWFGEYDKWIPDEELAKQFKGTKRLIRTLYWAEPLPPNAKYGIP